MPKPSAAVNVPAHVSVLKAVIASAAMLAAADLPAAAQGTSTGTPGARFDLGNWTLQLPVASGGSVLQIKGDKLESGYASEYFQTGSDGSMAFWCPVTGGTTPNSHYPRSELRETAPGGDWSLDGDHELRAVCRVLTVPSTGRVIIGQIHGSLDQSEIIKLLWDNGKLSAAVEPDRSSEIQLALGTYKLGDSLAYSIHMKAGMLEVRVGDKSVKHDYTGATWKTDKYYFKAGAYVQDDAGSATEGAKVAFYGLQVFPTPVAIAPAPERSGARSAVREGQAGLRSLWSGSGMTFGIPSGPGRLAADGRFAGYALRRH